MTIYICKRLIITIFVLLGTLFITFLLMVVVPGDPVESFVGQHASEETILQIRRDWGLDQPLANQFLKYISQILSGNLGQSYFTHESVAKNLVERFPTTFLLSLIAIIIGALVGLPAGIIAAISPHSIWEKIAMTLTLLGISLPVFWIGILVLMVASHLDTLPFINLLRPLQFNIFLAAFVLGIRPAALLSRITHEQMKEILKTDYILAAYARGIARKRIVLLHALKNALPPILTALALDFGSLLSGAAITETIFGIPGIGKYALSGLGRRDYPVIMGMVLFSAIIFVVVNLIVDLLIPLINPRLKYEK